jgi:hypothetical protein
VPLVTRVAQSLFALFMVLVFCYVVYQAEYGFGAFEPRAAIFPWVIGLPSLLLAIYVFIRDALQSTREVKVAESALWSEPEIAPAIARERTIAIAFWILGFLVAIWMLGFVPASAIATWLYLKFGTGEKWPVSLALAAGCWLFFFGVFDYALQLPFPHGALVEFFHDNIPEVANLFAAGG